MSWRCSPRTRIRPLWRKGCGSAFSRGSGSPPRSGSPRTCPRRSRSPPGCSTRATSCRISCSWACCCRCGAEQVAQTPGSTPTASRTALVAGASGLVGSRVLRLLLEDPAYARVTVLARRELPLSHKKLEQRVVSFDRLAQMADFPRVHDVFCCLGTTMKQAGSPDAFRKVDFTYVVELARVAVRYPRVRVRRYPPARRQAVKFPHPLTLLCGCILLAAAASHVLPPGQYDRRDDPTTGRKVVVAGTYHAVAPRPVGPFQALVAIPRGMADAAAVIFFVFLIGGAFTVVDETGALRQGVDWLVRRFGHSEALVVPAASLAFALGGVLDNMKEEIIALLPVMLLLARRLGYRPVVAVAMSLGAAAVGAAFSPINPFQVGIAQQLAQLPLLSGWLFRIAFLAAALGIWIWGTLAYAARTRTTPTTAPDPTVGTLDGRRGAVLALVLLTFAALVVGVLRFGWGFNEMAALFFAMGVVAGLVGGLGVGGTADALVAGFRSMAYAALLIGFARAIFITLEEGRIVDTIVHGLFTPVAQLPVALAALGMMVVHGLVHVPVPSPSGHAVLTLPILVPLADLLGLSRQVTVLAYQYGGGLCEPFTPTNGALLAILAAAQVPYEDWVRFALPLLLTLLALGAGAIGLGVAIGLQ